METFVVTTWGMDAGESAGVSKYGNIEMAVTKLFSNVNTVDERKLIKSELEKTGSTIVKDMYCDVVCAIDLVKEEKHVYGFVG